MTPSDLELLTQAVDGELSARDSRRLRRLLEASAEARVLLAHLESDRNRLLQAAPVAEVPGNLFSQIMARVAHTHPGRRSEITTPRKSSAYNPWAALAIAASLFIAVGGFWTAYVVRNSGGEVARHGQQHQGNPSQNADSIRNDLPPEHAPLASRPAEEPDRRTVVAVPPRPVEPATKPAPEIAAAPRPVMLPNIFTSPLLEPSAPFETVQVRLPFLAPLADVKDRSEALLREFDQPAYRLDLFGKNPNRCLDMLLSAAKSNGLTIHDARPKKGPQPTSFVVYIESLKPVEIRDLLVKLAAADSRQTNREFGLLHLSPANAADHREMKDLLGIDVGLWKRTDAVPATRSITAGTGDAVAKSVANGIARGPEKSAIALPLLPANLRPKPSSSMEIQKFLARRDGRPAGSVSLMIVLRNH